MKIIFLLSAFLLLSGCVSNSEQQNVEYQEFSKPWPGSEDGCVQMAKMDFYKICQEQLKKPGVITCDNWWSNVEVWIGEENGEQTCIIRIPSAVTMILKHQSGDI